MFFFFKKIRFFEEEKNNFLRFFLIFLVFLIFFGLFFEKFWIFFSYIIDFWIVLIFLKDFLGFFYIFLFFLFIYLFFFFNSFLVKFFHVFLGISFKVTKVTTGNIKLPKMGQNSIISSFFSKREKSLSQNPPQELEVSPRSGPYLLIILIVIKLTLRCE